MKCTTAHKSGTRLSSRRISVDTGSWTMQLCMSPLLHVTVVLQPSFYLSPLNGATCADEAMKDNFLGVDWGWARISVTMA